jgi:hypothetical protein
MLKFASLSTSQKKCVVALIEADPTIKERAGKITLKEVVAITQDLAAKRDSGAPKIGYPNWLFKSNKVERGLYQLPLPNETELSQYAKEIADKATPAVAKAKAKVAKLAQAKVIKVKTPKATKPVAEDNDEEVVVGSRLTKAIEQSEYIDEDVEDFNQILRENGIEI